MLRKIYQELVEIKKELHAIQKSMESKRENHSSELDEKAVVINSPIRLGPNSIARQIQLGNRKEKTIEENNMR